LIISLHHLVFHGYHGRSLFMWFWYIPAPDEALLISGSKRKSPDAEFRIVTGRGSFIWPIGQKARVLSLGLREVEIVEDCVTSQGVRLNVTSAAAFKVGTDPASIADAARCFLSAQNGVEEVVGAITAGHLRSVFSGSTVEQILTERDRVTGEIRKRCGADLARLGLVVAALGIQEIEDTSGYIANLAAPHTAAVAGQARIAQANADLEAAEREREVAELRAEYERDLEIKKAGYLAEAQKAKAEAAQAGALAETRAAQEVAEQQMALARRQAEVAELRLDSEVRQSAEAEAYKKRVLAEAERDQAKFAADAEAYRMLAIARAQTQVAKINAEPALPTEDQDQGRRARLRPRRAGEVSVVERAGTRGV
jgi:regulator of protease activity HflC (stomatin/prohibitin superfamily)